MIDIKERIRKLVETSYPLKNDSFMIFAKNKDFCQEFLRVILQDDKLEVIENDIQKVIPNAFYKNVVLDMLCRLKNNKLVNVEIQLTKEEEHAKRVFTYASKIRTYDLGKGEDYKEAKDIIVIYLTKEDIFKKGSTVYEVKMDIMTDKKERVEKWEAGLEVYYVNTEGLTNKTINEYLKLLTDKTTINNKYRITSEIKDELYSEGGIKMSSELMEIMELAEKKGIERGMQRGIEQGRVEGIEQGRIEGIEQGMQQGITNIIIRQFNDKKISANDAAGYLGISVEEFLNLL